MNSITVLQILKQGARIELASGYILQAIPECNYIETGYNLGCGYCQDGLRILNEEGLQLALDDANKFEAENKDNL